MNKHIKSKKNNKLHYKRIFSKEDRIFMKKYPMLHATATTFNISLGTINKNYKKIKELKFIQKNMFEIIYRFFICAKQANYDYKWESKWAYYEMLFKIANISI